MFWPISTGCGVTTPSPSKTPASTRLFTALPVPPSFRVVYEKMPRKGVHARWTDPADLHITIRYLGDVESSLIPAIRQALARVNRPPFSLEIEGLDFFDNPDQAVLYARVTSTRKLMTLCAEITDVLTPLGFDFGGRAYVPHVTLARLPGGPAGLASYIRAHGRSVRARGEAAGFSLMASAPPDNAAARYCVIETFPLS